MPGRNVRGHLRPTISSQQEEDQYSPVAHRARSRATLQNGTRRTSRRRRSRRRRRHNADSSQRERSRSLVDRRVVLESHPEPEDRPTSPASDQQSEGQPDICSICLGEIECDEDGCAIPCAHVFHTDCIIRWAEVRATCPSCRAIIPRVVREEVIDGMQRVVIWIEQLGQDIEVEVPAEVVRRRPKFIVTRNEDGELYLSFHQILSIL
uniref:RING-type domain-containing protein n=1 Tax=Pyxicephalus adspersus TaxID=30357 RepID=A0AAV3B2L4_PYXAD|nr:TPA: hypothetical protein GDO54_007018 [Pyxicephalus adspersus]